jgi:PAS domain S-box-containing protein
MGSSDKKRAPREYFEASPIGSFVIDETGSYVDVNPAGAEMVGYSREELLEMSIGEVTEGYDDHDAVPSFVETRATERTRSEVKLRHRDGSVVDVLIEAVALDDDRFIAYCQDISDLKQYERRLEEQRDNLNVLNEILRHDVRNDLQLVLAYGELIEDAAESDEVRERIQTVLDSAGHAVELTKTAGQMAEVMLTNEDKTRPVNLRSHVTSVVEEVRSTRSDAVITGETSVPRVTIRANDMLDSVFRNLIKNGIDHNNKDMPKVTLSGADRGDTVVVRVADNGPGVPDERKDAIFGKGNAGLESQGTGIGLYLVKTLVGIYGGEVRVEDNDPEGAVFVVELPKANQ